MLDKRIINTAVAGVTPSACTTDTVQILDGTPLESVATYQLDGNANDLTTNYNGTWGGTEAYTTGQFGQAAVFDGVSSVLSVPRSFSANSAYSVSAWMKMPSSGFTFLCLFWQNVGTNEIGLFYEGDIDRIVLRHKFQTNSDVTYTFPSRPNGWNHYAATFNGSNLGTIYFNGVPIASGALDPKGDISNTVYIGGGYTYNYNTYYREGEFDQVRFFNTALSAGAVTNLYNETVATASNTYINTPSLVAYYKMSDATDETGSYDGTASNVNFNVAGKFGNAGEFNGSSSLITTGITNSIIPINSDFTISAWVKIQSTGGFVFAEGNWNDWSTAGFGVQVVSSNRLEVSLANNGASGGTQVITSALTANTWIHMAVTIDIGNSLKIYINGAEVDSASLSTNSRNNVSGGFYIGSTVSGYYYDGSIDQVRIFNKAITSEEVETLYNEVQCVPDIVPASNFESVLYTANGGTLPVTGVGFTPDLVWVKSRVDTQQNLLTDSVRGVGNGLISNLTLSESGVASDANGKVQSFDLDGFTVNVGTNNQPTNNYTNDTSNGGSYVAWCWKAADTTTTISAGTVGNTIASDVRANPDAGFSIVTYTGNTTAGATIGHGLNNTPELIIFKRRNANNNWLTVQTTEGVGGYLDLTNTMTTGNYNAWLNNTNPTDTLITLNNYTYINGGNMLAYCFHSVDGYQKVGSYKGTGAAGNTIVTGFRPAFVMWKAAIRPSGGGSWYIYDNKRTTSNPQGQYLQANEPAQEFDGTSIFNIDFNSNGFTINGTNNEVNQSGSTYIFLAIAEEVFNPNGVTRNAIDPFGDGSEVALYKFEDNANDAEDNYDGADTNVTYSAGYIDKAAVFDGSSSIIYVNSFDTTTNFSISLWFKTSSSSNQVLANNGGGESTNIGFLWYLNTSGNIVLSTSSGGGVFGGTPTTSAYNDGNWHNAVLNYASNGVYSIYVDNQLVVSETSSRYTGASVAGRPFAIGAWSQLNQWWFNGSIDQVRIFDGALDSGEVAQLYNE